MIGVDRSELHAAWSDILDTGQWTEGKYVNLFEEEVAAFYGQHAIAFNSCGTALFSVLRHAEDGQVLVSNNTFAATAQMAQEAGHKVSLVDCNMVDGCMAGHDLLAKVGSGETTWAVVYTHVGGRVGASYGHVADICRAHDKVLVEDAAHALGCKEVGSRGQAACFSLYPTKAVPAGEGGVVITKSADLAERLRRFRNYGKHTIEGRVCYTGAGFNFRMDEWTAAVAYLQMCNIEKIMSARREAADMLTSVLDEWDPSRAGTGNYYKYVAHKAEANDLGVKRFAGQVYASTDQISRALDIEDPASFTKSVQFAREHCCIPIMPERFKGVEQLMDYLRSEPC